MMNTVQDFSKFAKDRRIGSQTVHDYLSYISPTIMEETTLHATQMDVFSRLMQDRIIYLGTSIDDTVANIINAQLLWLEQQGDGDITMMINSGGGSVYSGLAIVDTCNTITPDVKVNVVGIAASMAAVIASNGTKGKRFILPHSRVMIHQPRTTFGNNMMVASDIEIEAEEINKIKKELYEILTENSNRSYEEIEKLSDRDKWLTAQDAIDLGLMDEIIKKK